MGKINRIIAGKYVRLFFVLMPAVIALAGCDLFYNEEKLLESARQYQQSGEHKAATIELKKILQKNPQHKQARLLIADSYLALQQGEAAEKELRRAMRLGVKTEKILVPLAQAFLMQGAHEKIFSDTPLDKAGDEEQRNMLRIAHGYAYLAIQKNEQAMEMFSAAAKHDSTASSAYIGLSKAAMAAADMQKAYAEIARAIDFEAANSHAWSQKGVIEMAMGSTGAAKKSFEKVIELSPRQIFSMREYQARMKIIEILVSENNLDSAKKHLAVLTEKSPNVPLTKYMTGVIAYHEKDYGKARGHLEELIASSPGFMPAQLLAGAVYYAQQHYEQANNALTKFVNNAPTHVQARKLLGSVRMKMGLHQEAMDILKPIGAAADDVQLLAMIGRAAILNNDSEQAEAFFKQARSVNPENQLLKRELAGIYLQRGSYDEAIEELKTISGKDASQAGKMLIYAHLRKHDFAAARKVVNRLITNDEKNPESYFLAGAVELAAGSRVKARSYFTDALGVQADYLPGILSLAQMDFEEGNLTSAKARYRKVLKTDGGNIKAMLGLSALAGRENHTDEAVKWLTLAGEKNPAAPEPVIILSRYYLRTGKTDDAIRLLQKHVAGGNDNQTIMLLLSQAQLGTGQKNEALATANEIVKKWPKYPASYVQKARILEALGYDDMAGQSLKKALQINPDLLPTNLAYAAFNIKKGDFKQALSISHRIQKLYPKQVAGYNLEGEIYLREKNYPRAIKIFEQVHSKFPDTNSVRKLSLAYRAGGDSVQAIQILEKWINEHPSEASVRLDLALNYEEAKQTRKARGQYHAILEQSPDNVIALNNISLSYLNSDQAKALEYAEKAYQLRPDAAPIADTLGWILLAKGEKSRALQLLSHAAERSMHPSIQYHYAVALDQTGAGEKARQVLARVLETNAAFPEQESARKLRDALPH